MQAEVKKPFSQALYPAYESSFWKVSFSMNETVTKRFLFCFRLMMVVWILIANAFFHAIGFEYSWLIFLSNIMLYYNKHGTGYGSQPYSIPTRT